MSMQQPLEPELGPAEGGIPAADPGRGAPEPAPGFGVGSEEPDRTADAGPADAAAADAGPVGARPADDPPFRTPDPHQVGPDTGT